MPWYNYQVVAGWNDSASVVNFETYFTTPLRGQRVPLGSETRRSTGGHEVTDGFRDIVLEQAATPFSELEDYVTAVFGGWDGDETAEVTLRTRNRDNTFAYYNALAYLPKESNGDYEHETTVMVRNLRLRFLIVSDAAAP